MGNLVRSATALASPIAAQADQQIRAGLLGPLGCGRGQGRRDMHDDLTDAVNHARPERGSKLVGVLLLPATGDEQDPLGPEPLDLLGHLPYPPSAENNPGGRHVMHEIHWLQPLSLWPRGHSWAMLDAP